MTLSRSQLINHLESCLYSLVYLSFVCIQGINVIDLNTIFVSGRHSYSQKKQSLVRSTFYHMLSFGYCCCNFFTCIQNTSLQHYLALACFRAVLGQGKKEEKFRIAGLSQKITLWEIILVYLSWYSTTPTYVSYVYLTYSVLNLVVFLVESSALEQPE